MKPALDRAPAPAPPGTAPSGAAAPPVTAPLRQLDAAGLFWMLGLTALWGLNALSIKIVTQGLAPLMAAGLRGALALVLLTGYALLRGESLRFSGWLLFHGAINGLIFAAEFFLFYQGAAMTTGGHISIFINTAPFFVAIGAHYLLPGDRLNWLKSGGLSLAFAGIVVLFSNDILAHRDAVWRGDLLVLAGSMLWGSSTLYVKRFLVHRLSPLRMMLIQIVVSTPLLLGASWLLEAEPFRAVQPITWAMLAFQSGVVVFFTYVMWFRLLVRYPASTLQTFTLLSPVWGVVLAALLLHESVQPLMLLGMLFVGAGLYLVGRRRRA